MGPRRRGARGEGGQGGGLARRAAGHRRQRVRTGARPAPRRGRLRPAAFGTGRAPASPRRRAEPVEPGRPRRPPWASTRWADDPIRSVRCGRRPLCSSASGRPPARRCSRERPAGRCAAGTGVTVVVDYGPLGGGTQIGCDPTGAGKAASQVVPAAGFPLTYVNGEGFVCRIDGKPDDSDGELSTHAAGGRLLGALLVRRNLRVLEVLHQRGGWPLGARRAARSAGASRTAARARTRGPPTQTPDRPSPSPSQHPQPTDPPKPSAAPQPSRTPTPSASTPPASSAPPAIGAATPRPPSSGGPAAAGPNPGRTGSGHSKPGEARRRPTRPATASSG